MFEPKNILVPTDFSKFSDAALKKAADIAARYGSSIYLLHVLGMSEQVQQCAVDYCLSAEMVQQLEKETVKAAQERLKKEAAAIVKSKKVKVLFDIKKGSPAETILREEKAKKVDLIVIASHGKSGILKQLIGSVADKVVKGAKSPVVVVKP
ncbi:MAG: universal stress protein [Deltaproteobacteria bacterium]|nr:universal stress protein [Deltaproteobacteria bacterium]